MDTQKMSPQLKTMSQNFFWKQNCPHQDEPSFEMKSSLSKVKVYIKQINKNGKLLKLLQKCLLERRKEIVINQPFCDLQHNSVIRNL